MSAKATRLRAPHKSQIRYPSDGPQATKFEGSVMGVIHASPFAST